VFDVSQTEGDPLPDLDTEATGDADGLIGRLTAAADTLGVTIRIVSTDEWAHGGAKGICEQLSLVDMQPCIEVRDHDNHADLSAGSVRRQRSSLTFSTIDDLTLSVNYLSSFWALTEQCRE
jgi:hypothetical protein